MYHLVPVMVPSTAKSMWSGHQVNEYRWYALVQPPEFVFEQCEVCGNLPLKLSFRSIRSNQVPQSGKELPPAPHGS